MGEKVQSILFNCMPSYSLELHSLMLYPLFYMNVKWARVPKFSGQSDEEQLKAGASCIKHGNPGAARLSPEQCEGAQPAVAPGSRPTSASCTQGSNMKDSGLRGEACIGKSCRWDSALTQFFFFLIWDLWSPAVWRHWGLEIYQLEKCFYFDEFKWVKYFSNT